MNYYLCCYILWFGEWISFLRYYHFCVKNFIDMLKHTHLMCGYNKIVHFCLINLTFQISILKVKLNAFAISVLLLMNSLQFIVILFHIFVFFLCRGSSSVSINKSFRFLWFRDARSINIASGLNPYIIKKTPETTATTKRRAKENIWPSSTPNFNQIVKEINNFDWIG